MLRKNWLFLGLLGITGLTLAYTVGFPFMGDDYPQIAQNPRVQSWSAVPGYFTTHLWAHIPGAAARFYRPLFLLLLRVLHSILGLWTPGWHFVLVCSHLGASTLVYWFVRRWKDARTALLAAAIFALHPVHAEVVSWVSAISEPLLTSTLIGCLGLIGSGRARDQLLSLLLFVVALGVKETAIVWPLVIFVGYFDDFSRSIRRTLPFLGVAIGYLLLRVAVLGSITTPLIRETQLSAIYIPTALGEYFLHLIWPVGLSSFCEIRPNALSFLFVIPVILALCWIAQRSQYERLAVLILLIPLLPALNLRSIQLSALVQDRYLYLPSVGFAMLAALLVERMPKPVVSIVLTAMIFGCVFETRTYSDGEHFYARAVEAAPHNVEAREGLGRIYADKGNYKEAIKVLNPLVSQEGVPSSVLCSALVSLAYSEEHLGNRELALQHYLAAYRISPTSELEFHIEALRTQPAGGR